MFYPEEQGSVKVTLVRKNKGDILKGLLCSVPCADEWTQHNKPKGVQPETKEEAEMYSIKLNLTKAAYDRIVSTLVIQKMVGGIVGMANEVMALIVGAIEKGEKSIAVGVRDSKKKTEVKK